MQILKFKTTISNGGGVATVMPYFEAENSIGYWKVDTGSTDKVLTVSGREVDPQRVLSLVQRAGFRAELVTGAGTGGPDR